MITNVIMPKAGMAMEEGTIVRWLKSEGDYVNNGEELLEIETDKVNMTIEAEADGYLLQVLGHVGDVIPVTQTIAYIGSIDDTLPQDTAVPAAVKTPQTAAKMEFDYDVIVIGGGPAGYVAAIRAAQLGARAALIEKDQLGGTCLNRGCIPTKTYLESAKILRTLKHCEKMGVSVKADAVSFNLKTACENKNIVARKLTSGVGALLKSSGVEVITGIGKVLPDKTVEVGGKTYTAHKIIVATGSFPSQLPLPGTDHKRVLDSTQLLDLETLPRKLVIIGGGVIGVELACAFHSFGSTVTVIEFLDRLIPNMDASLSKTLQKSLVSSGIHIHTSAKCESITEDKNGGVIVHTTGGDYEADYVLVAVGRKPDLSGIEQSGVAIEKGAVVVDARMQTTVPGIYAPGDVNGMIMLAHAAFKMAEVAAENAMGMESAFDGQTIPSCVYTFPEVAGVGLTEEEARKGRDIIIGQFSFGINGRALAADLGEGYVKVIADKMNLEILGIQIIGPNATEIINEASLILHMEMDTEEMSQVVHAHPTYGEALFEACMDCMDRSPHTLKKTT